MHMVLGICLYPNCENKWESIDAMIRLAVHVIYVSHVFLDEFEQLNLIRLLYRSRPWLNSSENGVIGALWKKEQCFSQEGGIKIYFIQSSCLQETVSLKQKIRDYCKLGKHSVHTTDNETETLELAATVLDPSAFARLYLKIKNE